LVFPKQKALGNYTLRVGPNIPNLDQNGDGTPNQSGDAPIGDVATGTLTIDGLHVVSATANATLVPPGLSGITVTFNEGIQGTPAGQPSFLSQATLAGPSGPTGVSSVTDLTLGNTNTHDTWLVSFSQQTVGGLYTLTLGERTLDLAGNKLDQNQNHVG